MKQISIVALITAGLLTVPIAFAGDPQTIESGWDIEFIRDASNSADKEYATDAIAMGNRYVACFVEHSGGDQSSKNVTFLNSGEGGTYVTEIAQDVAIEGSTDDTVCAISVDPTNSIIGILYRNNTVNSAYSWVLQISDDFGLTFDEFEVTRTASTQTEWTPFLILDSTTKFVAGFFRSAGTAATCGYRTYISTNGGSTFTQSATIGSTTCTSVFRDYADSIRYGTDDYLLITRGETSGAQHSFSKSTNGGTSWGSLLAIGGTSTSNGDTGDIVYAANNLWWASITINSAAQVCTSTDETNWSCASFRVGVSVGNVASGYRQSSGLIHLTTRDQDAVPCELNDQCILETTTTDGTSFSTAVNIVEPEDTANANDQPLLQHNSYRLAGSSAFFLFEYRDADTGDDSDGLWLAFTFSPPAGTFSLDDPRDIRTTFDSNPRIYTRSFGADQIHRFNETLTLLNVNNNACPSTPSDSTYGLAVTGDGIPIIVCDATNPVFQGYRRFTNTLVPQNMIVRVTDGIGPIDAFNANNLTIYGRAVTDGIFTNVNQPPDDTICEREESSAIDGGDIDNWDGENSSYADASIGLFVVSTNDCTLVAQDETQPSIATAINNLTVWSGGSYGIRRHSYAAGFSTQATQATAAPTVNALRISKDALYLVVWNTGSGTVWLLNSTSTMDVLETFTVPNVRSCDMDANNNRIYCIDDVSVLFFEAFPFTFGFGGSGTVGTEHSDYAGDPFGHIESDTSGGGISPPSPPPPPGEGTGIFDEIIVNVATSWGLSNEAVAVIIGLIIIGIIAAATRNSHVIVIATILFVGVFIVFKMGLFPLAIVLMVGLIVIGGVVHSIFGGRSGNE